MTIQEWIKFNPQHINELSPEARIKAFAEMQSDGLALYSKVLEMQSKILELEAAHEEGAATIMRLAGEIGT